MRSRMKREGFWSLQENHAIQTESNLTFFFLLSPTGSIERERKRNKGKKREEKKKEFQETGFLLTESKGVKGKLSWSESHLILFLSFLFLLLFLLPYFFREKKEEGKRKRENGKKRKEFFATITHDDHHGDHWHKLWSISHSIWSSSNPIFWFLYHTLYKFFLYLYLYTILTITNSMIVFLNHSSLFLYLDIWLQWENRMQKR